MLKKLTPSSRALCQNDFLEWLGQGAEKSSASLVDTGPVCKDCDYKTTTGSKAYVTNYKCKVCGHNKTEKRDPMECMDASKCPHKNTNHLKSTKFSQVTYCMGCQTVIDKRSREDVIEAAETQKKLDVASERVQKTCSKIVVDEGLTTVQGYSVARTFHESIAKLLVERREDTPCTLR